jgi:hypothetical protein
MDAIFIVSAVLATISVGGVGMILLLIAMGKIEV